MTEHLLQKLEEKMMVLFSEVEGLRKDVQRLNQENATLRIEKENHTKKLHELIALLDAVNIVEGAISNAHITPVKPVLIQSQVFKEENF